MNNHRVSFSDLYHRPWELPIHHGDQGVLAQVSHMHLAHLNMYIYMSLEIKSSMNAYLDSSCLVRIDD